MPKKADTFEVIKGFNITLKDGTEERFDVGRSKPNFVSPKDFAPDAWKQLLAMEAVAPEGEVQKEDVPDPKDLRHQELQNMSKTKLVVEATRLKIHVTPDSMTNDEIIAAIEEAE